jgi:hypothetical protein
MLLFKLTPRNTRWGTGPQDFYGDLSVYNWFTGVRAYGLPGLYHVVGRDYREPYRYMTPYLEETLESLYEKDRLLLIAREDYTNNTEFIEHLWKQSNATLRVSATYPENYLGKQLMATFDFEALRTNEVQLFFNREHQETLPVYGRCRKAVLVDLTDDHDYVFTLRPARRELYIYSVEAEVV